MGQPVLSDGEFKVYQKLIFKEVGISLDDSKKTLVQSRLFKRLLNYKISSYSEYLRIVQIDTKEKMEMINLITTNETYFFRELSHFDFLEKSAKESNGKFRVWSAASSVGAEAYTIAMVLDSVKGRESWEIVGTDINTEVIKKARMGLYPEGWIKKIPSKFREKYCLKGRGKYEGQFLIDRALARNTKFDTNNLMMLNTSFGQFDIVFLRNVLIYFNNETRESVIKNVVANLKVGGYFIISLTENLQSLNLPNLEQVQSSIYRKIK